MARGWESKSIESQIESAKEKSPKSRVALTSEQQERARERQQLQLARAYLIQQAANVMNPTRAHALQQALKEVEEKLARLEVP